MPPATNTEEPDTESVDARRDTSTVTAVQSESTGQPSPQDSQGAANAANDDVAAADGAQSQLHTKPAAGGQQQQQNGVNGNQFPPPKTDKPRPHVCGTCGRCFARLEHLKRHERSHTKEKPFECPECTRCFARRDLLLRHQQKLHMTGNTSSRPRNGRRESVSGTSVSSSGRVRKNSIVSPNPAGLNLSVHRPRANTIDMSSLGLMDAHHGLGRMNGLGISVGPGMHMGPLPGPMGFDYRGMSNAMGAHGNGLHLKLETHGLDSMGVSQPLRTAPPVSFGHFELDQLFSPGTTVNPAQLHFGGPASATQPTFQHVPAMSQPPPIDENDEFGWMRTWNMQTQHDLSENAIEDSSPSRLSSGDSPGDFSETPGSANVMALQQGFQWPQPQLNGHRPSVGAFHLEALGNGLPILDPNQVMLSPNSLQDATPTGDTYFHQAMVQQQQQRQHQHQHQQQQQQPQPLHHHHHHLHQQQQQQQQHQQPQHHHHHSIPNHQASPVEVVHVNGATFFPPSVSNFSSDSPSMSGSSMTGSARQSSVTSISTDSITDSTRQALLASLSQPSVFGGHSHRKYSQPSISSPLSPNQVRHSSPGATLPSTADLRRYVDAFIQFAHPHLPFAHIPTLSFEADLFNSNTRTSIGGGYSPTPGASLNSNGAGCLILGMAAIGALYEYDHPASKELFDAAKKLIQLYLEDRRKHDMSAAVNGSPVNDSNNPPLWLVQAMLLTVIYGHQCGDKTAADVASNHTAALVSLARAAELTKPPIQTDLDNGDHLGFVDIKMDGVDAIASEPSQLQPQHDLHIQWLRWKAAEERKRTLFAIFVISSLLTTAYNQTPTIMNSEILLDLPCDEELWSAESAQEWQIRGGLAVAEASSISFAGALSTLLTANQRNAAYGSSAYSMDSSLGAVQSGDVFAHNDIIRPSTFGCLVLINALHNYIWETRSRHHSRQWTAQETESMFSHIEPALNAWQAAWKANDRHKLERPNPFGCGPLSADSIPLLDLAFVRLFVNLGRSKEAFWMRDFDQMAEELARGAEVVQHAEGALDKTEELTRRASSSSNGNRRPGQASMADPSSPRRERHLRKAAFYAADSLTIACNYNLTYADATGHDLPIQSALCFFDCGQVLAEWACTVQERIGSYLGVLGRDQIDFTQVPAIMLLEAEDVELLQRIERICDSMEGKRFQQESLLAMDLQQLNPSTPINGLRNNVNLSGCGYGSKILRIVAMMLEKAVVWPVTHVMAKALETQAGHMDQRAEASTVQ